PEAHPAPVTRRERVEATSRVRDGQRGRATVSVFSGNLPRGPPDLAQDRLEGVLLCSSPMGVVRASHCRVVFGSDRVVGVRRLEMPAKRGDPRSIRERSEEAGAVVSGEQPASLPGLRYLGNEQGEPSLRIEERDLEGLVCGFQRLLAGRPAGVEMGGANAEVDLGWN